MTTPLPETAPVHSLRLTKVGQRLQTFESWPLAVFGLSLGLNLLTVWYKHFDGLYGQDAYSYFAQSVDVQNYFSLFHHWQWEATPRLFYWPAGYPVQVALLTILTGANPGSVQLISLVAWAGAPALLTSFGRKMSGSWLVGLVAGTALALSGMGRQVAVSVMADAPALFWTILGVWLAWRARERGQGWWLLAAGLALGLAGITRYSALTAFPLLWVIWLWPGHSRKQTGWVWLLGGSMLFSLVYLPQFVINQLYPAYFWGGSWLTDFSPLNAFQSQFLTRDGLAVYPTPPLVFYLGYGLISLHLLTPLALPSTGLGLWWLTRVKKDGFQLALLLVWWLVPVLVFSCITYENERYSLTFVPPLALLAGLGVNWLWQQVKSWRLLGWQMAFKLGLVLVVVGMLAVSQRHVDGFIALKDADLAVTRQVEAQLPDNATLITFDISLTFDHYTGLKVRDLWFFDPASLPALQKEGPVYLLADQPNIVQQWTGKPVGQAFEAAYARAEGSPTQIGRFSLWKLKP